MLTKRENWKIYVNRSLSIIVIKGINHWKKNYMKWRFKEEEETTEKIHEKRNVWFVILILSNEKWNSRCNSYVTWWHSKVSHFLFFPFVSLWMKVGTNFTRPRLLFIFNEAAVSLETTKMLAFSNEKEITLENLEWKETLWRSSPKSESSCSYSKFLPNHIFKCILFHVFFHHIIINCKHIEHMGERKLGARSYIFSTFRNGLQ